jgi:predicted aldo/keto reductase-like oxidoreductase
LNEKEEVNQMLYQNFQKISLSTLGFGGMRMPVIDGDDGRIDEAKAKALIESAIYEGINYFDTAWGYHKGQSEIVMGKALSAYPRDSYYLASKFPGYDTANFPKVKAIFEKQLEKCQTDYFDFYLFHNVNESNIDFYLDPKYGVRDYLAEQRRLGKIHHLGFSTHGELPTIRRFLEAYGDDMEFMQIQLNWIDWTFQQGKEKVELAREYDLPVWVMEPLRGGKLAALPDGAMAQLEALRPGVSAAEWGFRFLQTIPGVQMILSGMSTPGQLGENCHIFAKSAPLNDKEWETLQKIAGAMIKKEEVPCTACHYCVDHCPQGLDIPKLIALYNEQHFTGGGFIVPTRLKTLGAGHLPCDCIACHSCEKVCPQNIKIAAVMQQFNDELLQNPRAKI